MGMYEISFVKGIDKLKSKLAGNKKKAEEEAE